MTFLQALTQQIYQSLQKEQVSQQTIRPITWSDPEADRLGQLKLNTTTPRLLKVSQLQAQKHYPKSRPLPFELNPLEQQSWLWLNEQGAQLSNPFTLKQIKKIKLKLAKQLHPDLGGSAFQFLQLMKHIQRLSQHTKVIESSLESNSR